MQWQANGNKLLNRDGFRSAVFERDKWACVMCKTTSAHDAHHIMERRLFSDGGYYLNNGASLCDSCHLKAEQTLISVEEIRDAVGIDKKDIVMPGHLEFQQKYDKWGNPVLPNGNRMMGELFDDSNVQKVLSSANLLNLFTKYVKYPRTPHLPISAGITDDDRVIKDYSCFEDKEVVVTLKMDGENTTMYDDYIHARSTADKKHWSKSWIKSFHAGIAPNIPPDMRIVVENLYATHSIEYKELDTYCYGLSAWTKLICHSWDDTLILFDALKIQPVKTLYRGKFDLFALLDLEEKIMEMGQEGYVVRLANEFHYKNFQTSVAKFVRANHVKTGQDHWFTSNNGKINQLKGKHEN